MPWRKGRVVALDVALELLPSLPHGRSRPGLGTWAPSGSQPTPGRSRFQGHTRGTLQTPGGRAPGFLLSWGNVQGHPR